MGHADVEMVPQPHGGALRRGGGRPKGAKDKVLAQIRAALEDTGTSGVVPALLRKASEGDVRAIELCLSYGIGKPTEKVELSGSHEGLMFVVPALARLSDDELDAAAKRLTDRARASDPRTEEAAGDPPVEDPGPSGAEAP